MSWYAEMILKEKRIEYDRNLDMVEYLASFWNSEAVNKIRESREANKQHAFKGDAEFEQSIIDGEFKKDELIKAIQRINSSNNNSADNDGQSGYHRKGMKKPTNLQDLLSRFD